MIEQTSKENSFGMPKTAQFSPYGIQDGDVHALIDGSFYDTLCGKTLYVAPDSEDYIWFGQYIDKVTCAECLNRLNDINLTLI